MRCPPETIVEWPDKLVNGLKRERLAPTAELSLAPETFRGVTNRSKQKLSDVADMGLSSAPDSMREKGLDGMSMSLVHGCEVRTGMRLSLPEQIMAERNKLDGQITSMARQSEEGTGADMRLSVPIVSDPKEKEECV